MEITECTAGSSKAWLGKRIVATLMPGALLFAMWPLNLPAFQDAQAPAPIATSAPAYAQQTPQQLQQLVAPIALYPDSLVAQILAGSTFPDQVVLAERWVQAHSDLKGDALGQAVDQQPWDPSIKALAAFPSVLGNMDKNLSWTSSLGDAYYNQQQGVMNAVQVMRQRAQAAGNLKSTPQQTVQAQDSTIVIQPASPDVVYVPAYDPWVVYGDPILAWPGWYPYPGIWYDGPFLSFGLGFGIGFFGGFGWGWGHWGFDWHNRYPIYNHDRYFSHSHTFYNRNAYYHGGGERGVATNVERGAGGSRGGYAGGYAGRGAEHGGGAEHGAGGERGGNAERSGGGYNRSGATGDPFGGRSAAARGYAQPRGESGVRSGAFSGYGHGGEARGFSSRGSSSVGGGGHAGGGGGGHGGGGRH